MYHNGRTNVWPKLRSVWFSTDIHTFVTRFCHWQATDVVFAMDFYCKESVWEDTEFLVADIMDLADFESD